MISKDVFYKKCRAIWQRTKLIRNFLEYWIYHSVLHDVYPKKIKCHWTQVPCEYIHFPEWIRTELVPSLVDNKCVQGQTNVSTDTHVRGWQHQRPWWGGVMTSASHKLDIMESGSHTQLSKSFLELFPLCLRHQPQKHCLEVWISCGVGVIWRTQVKHVF